VDLAEAAPTTAEVRFEWWGRGHGMDVTRPYQFRTGRWHSFSVAIWNVGTGYPGRVVVNVIVPEWLTLRMPDDNGALCRRAGSETRSR
jgi:hypothetical protein